MRSFITRRPALSLLAWSVLLGPVLAPAARAEEAPAGDRWAEAMQKFADQDAAHPHPKGRIVLTGSSSARLWKVEKAFPDLDPPILNRGFGGSTYRDMNKHAGLLLLKHRPRLAILYSGDNDIAAGRSTEEILADFQGVIDQLQAGPDAVTIAVIPAKPSPARWELVDKYRELNARIKQVCEQHDNMHYVDVWPPMLGGDGRPRPELFRDDNLHMTEAGYAIWNDAVRRLVGEAAGR